MVQSLAPNFLFKHGPRRSRNCKPTGWLATCQKKIATEWMTHQTDRMGYIAKVVRLSMVRFAEAAARCHKQKSRSPKAPAVQLVCARIKIEILRPTTQRVWLRMRYACQWLPQNLVVSETLGAPSRSNRQVSYLRQNARHLHSVQLCEIWHHIGHKRILH